MPEPRDLPAQVYGVVGNPVAHSRSPALHNAAFAAAGVDAVYLPLLVDDMQRFLDAFPDISGLSVTIPHKVPFCHIPPALPSSWSYPRCQVMCLVYAASPGLPMLHGDADETRQHCDMYMSCRRQPWRRQRRKIQWQTRLVPRTHWCGRRTARWQHTTQTGQRPFPRSSAASTAQQVSSLPLKRISICVKHAAPLPPRCSSSANADVDCREGVPCLDAAAGTQILCSTPCSACCRHTCVVRLVGSSSGTSPLAGKKVLVLGVGGAGRAIAFGAVQAGAQVRTVCTMQCRLTEPE